MTTVWLQIGQEGVAPTRLEVSLIASYFSSCDPGKGIPRQQKLPDTEQVSRTNQWDRATAAQGVSKAAWHCLCPPASPYCTEKKTEVSIGSTILPSGLS